MKQEKRVFISQPNYIAWKGYFDAINLADEYVVYDDVQYTKRDWRNRCLIKTATGLKWLSIPVLTKDRGPQRIRDARVADSRWNLRHWETLRHVYSKARCFKECRDFFEDLYRGLETPWLCEVNCRLISALCQYLGSNTRILSSSELAFDGDRSERLLTICKKLGATQYITGPTALNYLNQDSFEESQISIEFLDYTGYPEYPQAHPPFEHGVSLLDLIFSTGTQAKNYMKSFRIENLKPFTQDMLGEWAENGRS